MSGYGFDPSWSDERRRLALIERVYDPATTSRLEQLGVGAAWRCLDVGAGGGSIARWLRDRVGPDGSVVAVDLDTRFFETGIEARRLDILADELERDAYDLVHCRCLLHHLRSWSGGHFMRRCPTPTTRGRLRWQRRCKPQA